MKIFQQILWENVRVFVLTQENGSSWKFYFKANRKTLYSSKKKKEKKKEKTVTGIFKIAFRLRDRHVFV